MACTGHSDTGSCSTHTSEGVCETHSATGSCDTHTAVCSAHSGYQPALSELTFTDGTLNDSIKVQAAHINELRTAINTELERYFLDPVFTADLSTTDVVTADDILELRTELNNAYATTFSVGTVAAGETVLGSVVQELRDKTNVSRTVCACNCNYSCTCNCNYSCTCNCNYSCTCNCNYACTCNCNYSCTCNCNYACTCNCNYSCTCNCNYSCTCNCNYSDERLKKDIIYI